MTIIGVTGHKGRLGTELVENFGCVPMICDITDENQIINALREVRPDIIINCAAYTDVDGCETIDGYKRAIAVNTRGVEYLRKQFSRKLIHISSDYIFDGKNGPYKEYHRFSPVNAYGFSKLGGEELLRTNPYPGQTFIVRTTGLYGGCSGRPDFASMIVDHAYRKEDVVCVSDLYGNQTYIPHLSEALIALANLPWKSRFDIINIASHDVISRYDFGVMIGNSLKSDYVRTHVHPITRKDMESWVAPRPNKGGLNVKKAESMKLPIYTVYHGLREYKRNLSRV